MPDFASQPTKFVYNIKTPENITPKIICISGSNMDSLPNKKIFHNSLPNWILDYTSAPAYNMRVGSTRRQWEFRGPNTAHLYPPTTDFWSDRATARGKISGMSIAFTGGEDAGLNQLIKPRQYYARFNDPDKKLAELLVKLPQQLKVFGETCYPIIQSTVWNIFHMLFMAEYIGKENYIIRDVHLAAEQTLTMQVEHYMREHYSEKLSLDKIAGVFKISSKTLTRRFRQEGKVSPMARLNEIRIDIAKHMLVHGDRTGEIAIKIGFSDEFHLSKTFKKITGQSPRDFIKSLTE